MVVEYNCNMNIAINTSYENQPLEFEYENESVCQSHQIVHDNNMAGTSTASLQNSILLKTGVGVEHPSKPIAITQSKLRADLYATTENISSNDLGRDLNVCTDQKSTGTPECTKPTVHFNHINTADNKTEVGTGQSTNFKILILFLVTGLAFAFKQLTESDNKEIRSVQNITILKEPDFISKTSKTPATGTHFMQQTCDTEKFSNMQDVKKNLTSLWQRPEYQKSNVIMLNEFDGYFQSHVADTFAEKLKDGQLRDIYDCKFRTPSELNNSLMMDERPLAHIPFVSAENFKKTHPKMLELLHTLNKATKKHGYLSEFQGIYKINDTSFDLSDIGLNLVSRFRRVYERQNSNLRPVLQTKSQHTMIDINSENYASAKTSLEAAITSTYMELEILSSLIQSYFNYILAKHNGVELKQWHQDFYKFLQEIGAAGTCSGAISAETILQHLKDKSQKELQTIFRTSANVTELHIQVLKLFMYLLLCEGTIIEQQKTLQKIISLPDSADKAMVNKILSLYETNYQTVLRMLREHN